MQMVAQPQYESIMVESQVPVVVEHPVIETIETIIPSEPIPVMVKTLHETTVIQEAPTDIHKVELKTKAPVARSTPPVRTSVAQPSKSGFKWWWLAPLLCCLPLLCLPCVLCCPKKKYADTNLNKPTRP